MNAFPRGEREAIGLSAVVSVRVLAGTRETWRKNNFSACIAHARSRITSVLPTTRDVARYS